MVVFNTERPVRRKAVFKSDADGAAPAFPRLKLNPKLLVSGSFDDISRILPPDASDHFVGGFREALLHVWRGKLHLGRC